MTVIASIAAKNYLPRVRVLAESLRTHHPELQLQVLLADELFGELDPAAEPYHLLTLDQLRMADQHAFCFRYGIRQRAAALKPYLLHYLLDQGHRQVLFLDPDMLVTASLAPLLASLQQQAIVLTPHLLSPADGHLAAQREREILRAGQFNGGVVGVSDEPQGRAFLVWWQERLARHAQDSVAEGMYYDQRWLDLAPGLFDRLRVVRDSGYNVAHWNLAERPLHWRGIQLYSGEQPCRLLHFSGYDPCTPERLSSYADWVTTASSPALPGLLNDYRQRLLGAGQQQAASGKSAWEHFANGQPITPEIRAIFNTQPQAFADPFACSAGSFFAWLNAAADTHRPRLTNFWHSLPRVVPELRQRWPRHAGADRQAYLAWAHHEGWRRYGLPAPG